MPLFASAARTASWRLGIVCDRAVDIDEEIIAGVAQDSLIGVPRGSPDGIGAEMAGRAANPDVLDPGLRGYVEEAEIGAGAPPRAGC